MDITKVLYFKAVADAGSISGAAPLLGLSQPALSLQIQNLEYELGYKLFERHNRGLILTEEGRILKERSILLQEWAKETRSVLEGLSSLEGKLKVGTYTTASSYLLTPRLSEFFEKYPKINISYDYSSTEDILKKVRSLDLDCAVISEVPQTEGLLAEPFFTDELILVCAAKNKIMPHEIDKEDLRNISFLSYPLKHDFCYREVERKFGKFLKEANVKIESESFDTLKQCVLNDLGVTFMPKYLVTTELKEKRLRRIKLKSSELPLVFSLVTKSGRNPSPRLDKFRSFLQEKFN